MSRKRIICNGWHKYINDYPELPDSLRHEITKANIEGTLLPTFNQIYKPFTYFTPEQTKVVFLGSFPRSVFGEADGLALAAPANYPDFWHHDLKLALQQVSVNLPSLESLAEQGCLFINVRLTRTQDQNFAHAGLGWEDEIQKLLTRLSKDVPNVIYIFCDNLNGYKQFVNRNRNLVLDLDQWALEHAEDYLDKRGKGSINWNCKSV